MEINKVSSINIENNINTDTKKVNIKEVSNTQDNTKNKKIETKKDNNGSSYDKKLEKLVDDINKKGKLIDKAFSYKLHEKTGRYIVSIKEAESGKVITEIPSEESLDLFAKILETAGLLIDKKS